MHSVQYCQQSQLTAAMATEAFSQPEGIKSAGSISSYIVVDELIETWGDVHNYRLDTPEMHWTVVVGEGSHYEWVSE